MRARIGRLALAEVKIEALEERLRLDRIARYGKRSETLSDLQLELLDLEPGVSSEEVEAESEREPLTTPAEDNTARQPDQATAQASRAGRSCPAHLERVEQIIVCTAEQCQLRPVRQANHGHRLRRNGSARRAPGRVLRTRDQA